ncbi:MULTISPECIES: glycosyltransferase family 4 protein [Chryseobacterium]|nr:MULTISPECIES: glycosyltransferase family 1 protein [Chryseobacterium]
MRIHFFDRHIISDTISIEKVFSVIKNCLDKEGFEVKTFMNPYPGLSQMFKAMLFFKRNQGDINHISGDIHWACLLLNSNKTILTIHDLVGIGNYSSKLKKFLYKLIWLYFPLKKAKFITVISEKTEQEILNYYPWAKSKIRVIHNPLTNEPFFREPVENDKFKILIVGTRQNKNVERILEAVKDLDIEVLIVGETTSEQNQKIKTNKSLTFVKGFITDEELVALYRTCDVLCFPSLYEGFGMPIIEAQSNGCAVITSDMEPMRSVSGNSALLVDPYSVEDIREKILILIHDFEKRKEMVANGYENAKRFLPEEITRQYIELYKEVLHG